MSKRKNRGGGYPPPPQGVGPTGKFSERKIPGDEGAIGVAIEALGPPHNIVRLHFGKKISWIGMPRSMAVSFAEMILAAALQLPKDQ